MSPDQLLLEVLQESHRFGALGETPEVALVQSERFLAALGAASFVLDLGSGGGIPGLVLAARLPNLRIVLLDRRTARTDLLQRLVRRLGVADRVEVVSGDAVALGRTPRFGGMFDTVVCRSFGSPEVTARCAAPFLALGGRLVVSEPPDAASRWRVPAVAAAGLQPVESPPGLQYLVRAVTP